MTIYQRMGEVFLSAGLRGYLHEWRPTEAEPDMPDPYATFTIARDGDALNADDEEIMHEYRITIDLYSKGDLSTALADLRAALREGGFLDLPAADAAAQWGTAYRYHKRLEARYYCDGCD